MGFAVRLPQPDIDWRFGGTRQHSPNFSGRMDLARWNIFMICDREISLKAQAIARTKPAFVPLYWVVAYEFPSVVTHCRIPQPSRLTVFGGGGGRQPDDRLPKAVTLPIFLDKQ
jgi:hypothetical protein